MTTTALERAKQVVRNLTADEERSVILLASCRLCHAPSGLVCRKPSGKKTACHAERYADAQLGETSVA